MPNSFINMIRLLFQDEIVSTNTSNQVSKPFEVYKRIHHGCLLVPYLLIIIVEALNVAVKYIIMIGHLKGIVLPQCNFTTNY